MPATTPRSRPWLVMVTGEPGSGKTSLGLQLSAALRVPFFSRDQVRGGLLATAGLWTGRMHDPPPRAAAIETFVDVVEAALRQGVTSVMEFVVTPERTDAFRRLLEGSNCVVILTAAHDADARAEQRDRADPLLNRAEVLEALGYRSIEEYLDAPERARIRATMQRDFDLPLLHVSTAGGYDPTLDAVAEWVIDRARHGASGR